jgi:CheY-like chemotaxis protein
MTSKRPRVLLVEDDLDLAEVTCQWLMQDGFSVVMARDGARALAALDSFTPDVIVADLMMPGMDGFVFLREYRRRPGPQAPVLVVSAFSGFLEAVQKLGPVAFLQKPFDIEALEQHVLALARGEPLRSSPVRDEFDETRRLEEVTRLRLEEPAPGLLLGRFTQRVADIFGVPICLVSVVTRTRQYWTAFCGLSAELAEERGTPREHSFCAHSVAGRAPLVVQDAHENPCFEDNPLVRTLGLRFYAGVPLVTRGGEAVGTLCVLDFRPHLFGFFDLELLSVLSRRVLAELELRERLLAPQEPEPAFRYLHDVDAALDVFSREAFCELLTVMTCRAAGHRQVLSVVGVDVPEPQLEPAARALEGAFRRGVLGRLGRTRLGLVVPGMGAAEAEALARTAVGDGARLAAASVSSFPAIALDALRLVEQSLKHPPG